MRITNNAVSRNALNTLQRSLRQVDEAQHRASTGLRVERPSDDPSAVSSVMTTDRSLRAITQYKRNIDSAASRVSREENVLDSVSLLLERAKELALGQAGASADAQTRLVTKSEIDAIITQIIQLGNTSHEGEFLFGGDQSQTAPFTTVTPPFAAVPPTGVRRAEISSALSVRTNHNGSDVFLNSGVLASLDQLSTGLGTNDPLVITASLTSLDSAHANVQVLTGETGAASQQFDVAKANLDALNASLQTFKSSLQDVDLEQAVTELVGRQTAYQAAMLATSRVMSLNLADYLR